MELNDEATIRRRERQRLALWVVRFNLLPVALFFAFGSFAAYVAWVAWVVFAIAVTVYWFQGDAQGVKP